MSSSSLLRIAVAMGMLANIAGCMNDWEVLDPALFAPDQDQFQPLEALADQPEAVVRLYGARDPILGTIMMHAWFVTKPAGETTFDRWELWGAKDGPNGHVFKNLFDPLEQFPEEAIIGELTGPAAQEVIDFLENEAYTYPCRDVFFYVPGPNCNTFAQWVVDRTGWDIELPPGAVGKAVEPDCPQPRTGGLARIAGSGPICR